MTVVYDGAVHWIQRIETFWVPAEQDYGMVIAHYEDCPSCPRARARR